MTGLSTYAVTTMLSGPRTRSNVRGTLGQDKAIIAGYAGASIGHIVVISGHEQTTDTLEVMDPAIGGKTYYSFTYFTSNSNWSWRESLYN